MFVTPRFNLINRMSNLINRMSNPEVQVDDDDDIVYLEKNDPHRVYLVTLSQLDESKFPTRESFGQACVGAFGGNKVLYFACGRENHKETGEHYHVSLRLNSSQRWLYAKQHLMDTFNVVANFAESPKDAMYAGAYRYAAKHDAEIFIGNCLEKHPPLDMIGQNKSAARANATYRANRKSAGDENTGKSKKAKHEKMTKLDVSDFIRANDIRTPEQLMAVTESRRQCGDHSLAAFVLRLGQKSRGELIEDTWLMAESLQKVKESSVPRMERVHRSLQSECLPGCEGLWLKCALEVLAKNKINKYVFADALRTLIQKGRGKHRNMLLVGPSNCGKTFLVEPVCAVLKGTFANPPSSVFSWIGVESAPAIWLNDFRWAPRGKGGCIGWDDFLRLLEGGEVNLPAPMNAFSKHIKITSDLPIIATSLDEIRYWKNDPDESQTSRHVIENEMMESRWKVFRLSYRFTEEEKIKDIPKCGRCFSELLMVGNDE